MLKSRGKQKGIIQTINPVVEIIGKSFVKSSGSVGASGATG